MEATPKEWKQMMQSFTSRGASHCDRDTFSFKPRDKNLATASSNSQRRFYHSSDFDSIIVILWPHWLLTGIKKTKNDCTWGVLDWLSFAVSQAPGVLGGAMYKQ